jgi:hypothetical protein
MHRDNRSATASASLVEIFSAMLLSALLVGMMVSDSIAAITATRPGCTKPSNGCSLGCHAIRGGCTGDCDTSDPNCADCRCEPVPNESPLLCWCR